MKILKIAVLIGALACILIGCSQNPPSAGEASPPETPQDLITTETYKGVGGN